MKPYVLKNTPAAAAALTVSKFEIFLIPQFAARNRPTIKNVVRVIDFFDLEMIHGLALICPGFESHIGRCSSNDTRLHLCGGRIFISCVHLGCAAKLARLNANIFKLLHLDVEEDLFPWELAINGRN